MTMTLDDRPDWVDQDESPWSPHRGLKRTGGFVVVEPTSWYDSPYVRQARCPLIVQIPAGISQPWLEAGIAQLQAFSAYEANWNGYGERPIASKAIMRAAMILDLVSGTAGARPSAVVPLGTGGVQVEWGDRGELVVEITPEGRAQVIAGDAGLEWSLSEQADYVQLLRFLPAE